MLKIKSSTFLEVSLLEDDVEDGVETAVEGGGGGMAAEGHVPLLPPTHLQ